MLANEISILTYRKTHFIFTTTVLRRLFITDLESDIVTFL